MFERMTGHARRVLVLAQMEAKVLRHPNLGTEDLLIALMELEDDLPARALQQLGVSVETARENVEKMQLPTAAQPYEGEVPFTDNAKKCVAGAAREVSQLGHDLIGSEHLLLSIIRNDSDAVIAVYKIYPGDVRQAIIRLMTEQVEQPTPSAPASREPAVRSSAVIADEITELMLRMRELNTELDEATRRETGVDPKYVH